MSDPIADVLRARYPEDIFGNLAGSKSVQLAAVKRIYRRLALATHPDSHKSNPDAGEAFEKLHQLRDDAIEAVTAASYGECKAPKSRAIVVQSPRASYTIQTGPKALDLADLFRAASDQSAQPVLLKVARSPEDNDMLANEAAVLRHLRTPDRPEAGGFLPLVPNLLESFELSQSGALRRVNVFAQAKGYFSLVQVHRAFPNGLDPKHMAWIFRQLLLVLGYVHARGYVHGSVLPPHVLIHPAHDLLLVDFCAAVQNDMPIPVMSEEYADWYPPEVPAKSSPAPATDIAMASGCMRYLLGRQALHPRLQGFFAWCELPSVTRRPPDAWLTRDEFSRLIEDLWGPRRRIPFTMPDNYTL